MSPSQFSVSRVIKLARHEISMPWNCRSMKLLCLNLWRAQDNDDHNIGPSQRDNNTLHSLNVNGHHGRPFSYGLFHNCDAPPRGITTNKGTFIRVPQRAGSPSVNGDSWLVVVDHVIACRASIPTAHQEIRGEFPSQLDTNVGKCRAILVWLVGPYLHTCICKRCCSTPWENC